MHELRRMAYLDALGVDAYVSRAQLPGAAVTRRLAIITAPVQDVPSSSNELPPAGGMPDFALPPESESRPATAHIAQRTSVKQSPEPLPEAAVSAPQKAVPPFSLVAIVAGGWLWLEDLGGMPLTKAQLQLIQSMARALGAVDASADNTGSDAAQPEVSQFDWPIHTNQQLDLGEDAVRASVAGFIGRKLEQHRCRGLVLLGQSCQTRVPPEQVGVLTASTMGSAEILANASLKSQVWRDLLPIVGAR